MVRWFSNPPPVSPSAVPALGVALCLNTLLAAGAVLAHGWFHDSADELVQDAIAMVVPAYAAFCLATAVLYGIAGAAWTGWSWWRVPLATLAAAALGWSVNVLLMSWHAAQAGWVLPDRLAPGAPALRALLIVMILSVLALVALWSTLLTRRLNVSVQTDQV